jgi:signal transduction histidine kinase
MNLVSNPVKFTESGEVAISVGWLEQDDERIVLDFSIKNTGIGMPLDKQEGIFESFEYSATETVCKVSSSRLGLSILKRLVGRQNGKVFVNSKPNHGSHFHFILLFGKNSKPGF